MRRWSHTDLEILRRILVGLHPSLDGAKRIVYDAGIDLARIDFTGAPETMWWNVLSYTNERYKTDEIVRKALEEDPDHPALLNIQQRAAITPTSIDAFNEVLLAGRRPFVNRANLRAKLLELVTPDGASVMLIDGGPQSGKSYSYFLINHIAPIKGYQVNKFSIAKHLQPDQIAGEVLSRLDAPMQLPAIGNESAQRWAEKLADEIYKAVKLKSERRIFVFDDPPTTQLPDGTVLPIPLPEGTLSFLVRLTIYADEELRDLLRVVLTGFKPPLPPHIDDVAERDTTEPLTPAHMVAAIMQVAKARAWSVSQVAVQKKVDEYHLLPNRTLNDGFRFIRGLLQKLEGGIQ